MFVVLVDVINITTLVVPGMSLSFTQVRAIEEGAVDNVLFCLCAFRIYI